MRDLELFDAGRHYGILDEIKLLMRINFYKTEKTIRVPAKRRCIHRLYGMIIKKGSYQMATPFITSKSEDINYLASPS
jgi:hypothetical protein